MSWWTLQRARQLYSLILWLCMMVCRDRVRREFEHAERPWSLWRSLGNTGLP